MPDAAAQHVSKRQWSGLGEYLARPNIRLLSDESRERARDEWTEVTRQEEQLEDALLIGLVGGTGVGKSTFINALAGEVVSRSSDRRPTTDRVIVYRHADTEIPEDVPTDDLAQPQVLHRRSELTKVILFDFPDFDSAERQHTHILRRYLEHLDVLLIVVDDMKYGDRRLYELLASLDHSQANLFVLLNKIDRLQLRYGGDTEGVVDDLVDDLQEKFQQYADIRLADDQLFPISAGEVFQARVAKRVTNHTARFQLVEKLLSSFQIEKHRRRAKEQNIDSRKSRLVDQVRQLALGDENRSILAETKQLLTEWQLELTYAVQAIPQEILLERERRALRKSSMRRVGPQWGFPFSFVFTLFGEMPWSKRSESMTDPHELAARVYQHYRGFFEAVKNLQARFRSEFVGAEVALSGSPGGDTPEQWSAAMAAKMRSLLQAGERPVSRLERIAAHLPAAATLFFAIWSCVYRLFDADYGFFKGLGVALLSAINPTFVLGLLVSLLVAYLLVSGVLWIREAQALNVQVAAAEQSVRDDVLAKRDQVLSSLDADVAALSSEYDQVALLVGD